MATRSGPTSPLSTRARSTRTAPTRKDVVAGAGRWAERQCLACAAGSTCLAWTARAVPWAPAARAASHVAAVGMRSVRGREGRAARGLRRRRGGSPAEPVGRPPTPPPCCSLLTPPLSLCPLVAGRALPAGRAPRRGAPAAEGEAKRGDMRGRMSHARMVRERARKMAGDAEESKRGATSQGLPTVGVGALRPLTRSPRPSSSFHRPGCRVPSAWTRRHKGCAAPRWRRRASPARGGERRATGSWWTRCALARSPLHAPPRGPCA